MTEPVADEHAPEVAASRASSLARLARDEEVVDGLPVLAEVRPIDRAARAALPAVQAAAAAATGFVAGAATVALVKRHSARKLARARSAGAPAPADMLPIVGSRGRSWSTCT